MKQPFKWTQLQQAFRTPLNTQDKDFLRKSAKMFGSTLQKFQDQQNFLEFCKKEELAQDELRFGFHLASLLILWQDLDDFHKLGQNENLTNAFGALGEVSKKLVLILDALAAQEIEKN